MCRLKSITPKRKQLEVKFERICKQICKPEKWCSKCRIYPLYSNELDNINSVK